MAAGAVGGGVSPARRAGPGGADAARRGAGRGAGRGPDAEPDGGRTRSRTGAGRGAGRGARRQGRGARRAGEEDVRFRRVVIGQSELSFR
jgi:hypothetical protein